MFQLIVQYFTPKTGINVKLLDFYEDPEKTSNDILNAIKSRLKKQNLPLKYISAYSAGNASVNFGNRHSVFTSFEKRMSLHCTGWLQGSYHSQCYLTCC